MKRRICVVSAALSASPLAFGVVPALAATHKVTKPRKKPAIQKRVATTCTTNTALHDRSRGHNDHASVTCSTSDGIHNACTDKLSLTTP